MIQTCTVDSQILLVQSIIASSARYEFQPSYDNGLTIAVYVGMLIGALFWGGTADVIGRKYAFNSSLLISSVFCIVAGAANSWILLAAFVSLAAFGAGGNLVLDTAVFLEFLPSQKQWLLTLMAAWWGLGQLVAGLFAWAFLPNYSCPGDPAETGVACGWGNNPGWRYVWFGVSRRVTSLIACGALTELCTANGALVFVMSILRITVIRVCPPRLILPCVGCVRLDVSPYEFGTGRRSMRPISWPRLNRCSPQSILCHDRAP